MKLAPVLSVCVPPQNQSTVSVSVWNCPELTPPIRLSWPLRTSTRPALLKSGPWDELDGPELREARAGFPEDARVVDRSSHWEGRARKMCRPPSGLSFRQPGLLIADPWARARSPLKMEQRPELLSAHPESCRLVPAPPLISMVALASTLMAARLNVPLFQFSTAGCPGLPRTCTLPRPLHDERISRLPVENAGGSGFKAPTWAVPSMVAPIGQRLVPGPVKRLVVPPLA